jgi:thioredoxin reductase
MADRTLSHPKIKPVWDSVVTKILGEGRDKVTGVALKNLKTNKGNRIAPPEECCGNRPRSQHTDLQGARLKWIKTATSFETWS